MTARTMNRVADRKPWTKAEDQLIREMYPAGDRDALFIALGRTPGAVRRRAAYMTIRRVIRKKPPRGPQRKRAREAGEALPAESDSLRASRLALLRHLAASGPQRLEALERPAFAEALSGLWADPLFLREGKPPNSTWRLSPAGWTELRRER